MLTSNQDISSDKKNKTTTEEKKREKEGRNPTMLLRCYSKEYWPNRARLIMKLGFDLLLLSFVPIFGEKKASADFYFLYADFHFLHIIVQILKG